MKKVLIREVIQRHVFICPGLYLICNKSYRFAYTTVENRARFLDMNIQILSRALMS